ncbi:hypothetical protein PUN28_016081 [Cardiocondyla obscurior]|uniref:Uncharacterized protein n=1 Tax=Cardiocondyla obscurior TaxID=286306 RepID=A0AAW2ETF3_9HYME
MSELCHHPLCAPEHLSNWRCFRSWVLYAYTRTSCSVKIALNIAQRIPIRSRLLNAQIFFTIFTKPLQVINIITVSSSSSGGIFVLQITSPRTVQLRYCIPRLFRETVKYSKP